MFRQPYLPIAQPMFRPPYVPTHLCSDNPMFRQPALKIVLTPRDLQGHAIILQDRCVASAQVRGLGNSFTALFSKSWPYNLSVPALPTNLRSL